ncbi:MAG: pectate lyase [Isosphaeraceae bacterium]
MTSLVSPQGATWRDPESTLPPGRCDSGRGADLRHERSGLSLVDLREAFRLLVSRRRGRPDRRKRPVAPVEPGDWPKNVDTGAAASTQPPERIEGTFDNGASLGEIRFLARAFHATGREAYRDAASKGIDHVLAAQYPVGGWPQRFPPGKGYARHVTFNDNTMVNLMTLMRDVAHASDFDFVGAAHRENARRAFDTAVACIVRAQIRVGDRLTVWCAQHDENTLEPRGARTYELPSLSGAESAGILLLLMSLENPSPEVVRAIEAGVAWFKSARIDGIREVRIAGNKVIERDPSAPPLWARFYEIDTGRPFFCGRDGVKKYDLSEIEAERRNGYGWYGTWGERVATRHAEWKTARAATRP